MSYAAGQVSILKKLIVDDVFLKLALQILQILEAFQLKLELVHYSKNEKKLFIDLALNRFSLLASLRVLEAAE